MADIMQLAKLAGIWASFKDVWQNDYTVSESTLRHLLKALGFPADMPEEAEQSLQKLKSQRESIFPQVRVVQAHHRCRLAAPSSTAWELKGEDDAVQSGEVVRDAIILPPLKPGYYELSITHLSEKIECFVIVAPERCWQPDSMAKGKRVWGISAQLYGIVSDNNWGMGDLGDLATLVKFSAERKASVIGINPLHALFPADGHRYAPYDPSSRLFLNVLYIDISAIEEFSACAEAQKIWKDAAFQEKLSRARKAEHVDYPLVSELKREILRPLYAHFKTLGKHEGFERFRAEFGERLQRHATFDALCDHFHEKNGVAKDWYQWPETYRDPASQDVAAFAAAHADLIDFYIWLQWIADAQLARAQNLALTGGMDIGLCRDLAVGAGGAGAETWCSPSSFIKGAHIGAPPDEYNPRGQNWGLCAFNPFALRAGKYESYIALLRNNMRHCRAVRIDHAFGLSRMFLIPDGKPATEGSYIDFPFEEMLAILRLESHRHQCMVIGEDLGTFPPNYKDAAANSGLLSYKVMYFEREDGGAFRRPEAYEPQALATFSTHDLPTLAGWLKGEDIDEKQRMNIYPSDELLHRDRHCRERDPGFLKEALARELGETDVPFEEQVQLFLARTPCAIVAVQVEDLLGVVPQANIPATTIERPNWRMKLPVRLEDIMNDQRLKTFGTRMTDARAKPLIDYPRATYRLQFHKDFTFYDAAKVISYLAKLGVSHVYASPYLQARPGSKHGYDTTAYDRLNAELGGEEGYKVFCQALEAHGLKQILDFVPNHMGVGGADNAWWLSVLEWGRQSPYAGYFDITWEARYKNDTPNIILPFLGDHYGDVLDRGELKLAFDEKEGSFSVWHFQHRFSICPRDYPLICDAIAPVDSFQDGEIRKAELAVNRGLRDTIARCVNAINNDKARLHALLERQHYRLAFWRVASSDINFRRFFDINDLAGVRVEDGNLFNAMHGFVLSLIAEGKISGLRIDHVDGLADPAAYCRNLRKRAGSSLYIVTEKILEPHENLPPGWDTQGTSGYDALNMISGVFVNPRGERTLDKTYRSFIGEASEWETVAYDAKLLVLESTLASELQTLTLLLKRIAEGSPYTRDYPFDTLKEALKEIIGWFPVYRTYVTPEHISEDDVRIITSAANRAKKLSPLVDRSVYDFVASLLMLEDEDPQAPILNFVRKFQQLTGPVMAKGVEDTVFYRFNRLVSLNEVGASPARFGVPLKNFHQMMKARSEQMPHSMLATATHDTKRGEDMRTRLHVLSERPLLWKKCAFRWAQYNRTCRSIDDGKPIPSPNDEYFIYQTLIGSWPNELMALPLNVDALEPYLKRLEDYFIKALREAKVRTTWNNPDHAYEEGILKFVRHILDPARQNPFIGDLVEHIRCLAVPGMLNSLAQTTLKLTLPGVPDIYQGCELWDYSLVDPDNRRHVDYKAREDFLAQNEPLARQLLHWQDGKVKQHLIHTLLLHRAKHPDLYTFGDYEPLMASGDKAPNVLAFSRSWKKQKLIVAMQVLRAGKIGKDFALPQQSLQKIWLEVPKGRYRNILTGHHVNIENDILGLMHDFPIVVLAV